VDDPEVEDHDSGDGTEEDGVRGHEVEEGTRAFEDLPGDEGPGEDGADELAATDVDVLREQGCEIIRSGQ